MTDRELAEFDRLAEKVANGTDTKEENRRYYKLADKGQKEMEDEAEEAWRRNGLASVMGPDPESRTWDADW